MTMPYARMLHTDEEAELFVDNILCIDRREKRKAINLITNAERNLRGSDNASTLHNEQYRDFKFRAIKERDVLRDRVLHELIRMPRLSNDDDIKLGRGGAAPNTAVKAERKLFLLIGPPAAGKSTIANSIADLFGCYILDSDYAKRKLPEFYNQTGGASLVHEESDELVFSRSEGNLMGHCIKNNYNIVVPKIGHTIESIFRVVNSTKELGYDAYLISVDLDRIKATRRAYNRFKKTKRYVPLSLIFDVYSNEPSLNYFRIRQQHSSKFGGFAQLSTDVKLGQAPILLEEANMPELRTLYGGDHA